MVFAFNLLFSTLCAFCFSRYYKVGEKNRYAANLLFLMPVWILWVIICGGQYGVGTDYFSYTEIFSGQHLSTYYYKKEYLFTWVAEFLSKNGLSPQLGFYIFYVVTTLCFIYIISKLEHETSFIFMALYLAVSTAFNNQLNGLRQYVALFIATCGVMTMYGKNGVWRYLICVLIATLIHSSSVLFLPLIYFKYRPDIRAVPAFIMVMLALAFSLFGSFDIIWNLLGNVIPVQYLHYMGGEFDASHGLIKMVTKLMYVPFYILSLDLLRKEKLKGFDMYLYKLGIISYAIRLAVLDNRIFNRVGVSFILIAIFPLYYLLKDWYERKQYIKLTLTLLFFMAFYLMKVVAMPKAEYLFNSIYFMDV